MSLPIDEPRETELEKAWKLVHAGKADFGTWTKLLSCADNEKVLSSAESVPATWLCAFSSNPSPSGKIGVTSFSVQFARLTLSSEIYRRDSQSLFEIPRRISPMLRVLEEVR